MDIVFKKATLNNLVDIQRLNAKLFQNQYEYDKDLVLDWPLSNEGQKYFKNLIENEIVYIAYDNDIIVGYIAGSYDKGIPYLTRKVAEVDNMYVNDEYRGQNIGSKLVNIFKDECNKKDIFSYDVSVYWENEKGIKFYERNGFERKLDLSLSCDDVQRRNNDESN